MKKVKFRKSDIKSLLIDLYGSKEEFISEYENYLAEKILKFENFDINEEKRILNFLQNHLKNPNISRCNVILNDYNNS